jgi:hypothetical protein
MAIAGDLQMRPLLARCDLGLAGVHRRSGQPDRTRYHLTRAAALFQAMKMPYWARRAAQEETLSPPSSLSGGSAR